MTDLDERYDRFMRENGKRLNLASMTEVAVLKSMTAKNVRMEADWDLIRRILGTHPVLVMAPVEPDPGLQMCDHILCVNDELHVFTNIRDLEEYIYRKNVVDGTPERVFDVGAMPFAMAVDVADRYHKDLYIDDLMAEGTKCLAYIPRTQTLRVAGYKKI
ncbi:MAG: hypothetical protein IJ083_01600 [Clostridia bacterium]|nr:hypothetical protein [Clostridia bacterium]